METDSRFNPVNRSNRLTNRPVHRTGIRNQFTGGPPGFPAASTHGPPLPGRQFPQAGNKAASGRLAPSGGGQPRPHLRDPLAGRELRRRGRDVGG
jgi:hypothetical protein